MPAAPTPTPRPHRRASRWLLLALCASSSALPAAPLALEKDELKLGFIKLTDMAPLAIAYERGYFEDEGLYVTLESQANWKVLLDRVITGELDGAQMLAGQPLAATIGYGTRAHIVTPLALSLNGNAITVSNQVWALMKPHLPMAGGRPRHPISADALGPALAQFRAEGRPFTFGMVFPVSSHNYELRYWLAAAGIHPGFYSASDVSGQLLGDVLLSVTPPPQMPVTLESGTINGYCVGEPWNQQAVARGLGVPVVTGQAIWNNNPEKVFGLTRAFVERHPNTTVALTKALIRAARWLDADGLGNRAEAVQILARREYVGADAEVIGSSMTGSFEFEQGDVRDAPELTLFFRHHASYPYYSDAIWTLTQMRRWGQIAEARPDDWYAEIARAVYRPDLYRRAAKLLIADGLAEREEFPFDSDGYRAASSASIDGLRFDGRQPNAYLDSLSIGLKAGQTIAAGTLVDAGPRSDAHD
jgi:nitrate/nitrite transport system substrate-binding protein